MATRRHDRSNTQSRPGARPVARGATGSGMSGAGRPASSGVHAPIPSSGVHAPTTASGVHAPIPGSGVHSTASGSGPRSTALDRRATGNRSEGTGNKPGAKAKQFGQRGMGLRAKFMLVLSGVTAAALIALGVSMAATTNNFLFGQKQHSGVEIARMAAQIGSAVNARLAFFKQLKSNPKFSGVEIPLPTRAEIERDLVAYLNDARDWGGNGDFSFSDILAIRFDCPSIPEISQVGIGELEQRSSRGTSYPSIYVPKTGGSVTLPPGISVEEQVKQGSAGDIPIYRFKIALDKSFGQASVGTDPANVRVDIAAASVQRVSRNLFMTIGIAVFIAIGVVVAVANWLAGNITRPLDMLIADMKVVARGKLDHETKARSNDEIGTLAGEFNRMTGNLKIAQVALVEQEKAEYELSIAREVQRQLLPAEAPTILGYDSAAFYQGAKAVSGDYFDFIPLGNGLWGFIIADVSGKGIPGSMVMAVTRTIVRLVANKHLNRAAETLKETNRLISKQIKRGMFVTALYAILDENTGTLTYASAGHNPMVIYRAATGSYELANAKGIALGFNEGPLFDKTIQEQTTVLGPGDTMLIYTDGFPEAMNGANEEFGDEAFYQTIAQHGSLDARGQIAKLVEAIAGHRGDAEQSDDLTIIAVRNVAHT
jgi:serine phosphatase RsbU (regulator of sigma subunit)